MSKFKFVLILSVLGSIISCGGEISDEPDPVALSASTLNIKNTTDTSGNPATYDEFYLSTERAENAHADGTVSSCKGSIVARDIPPGTTKSVKTTMCNSFYFYCFKGTYTSGKNNGKTFYKATLLFKYITCGIQANIP